MTIEPLRPFQAEDVPFFLRSPKSGIWYEPRLGKTVVSCNIIVQANCKRVLICCPVNAIGVWEDHITEWTAHLTPGTPVQLVRVRGTQKERDAAWRTPFGPGISVYIVTYISLLRDFQRGILPNGINGFDAAFFDEYHRYLRSRLTKSFDLMKQLLKTIPRYHFLSGTPTDEQPEAFWTILHLCNPKLFSSYWNFVKSFHVVVPKPYGGLEICQPKASALQQWYWTLNQWGRVRLRKDCAPQMPAVQRQLLHVNMTPDQKALYDDLWEDDMAFTPEGQFLIASSRMETYIRCRQILTCPKILDPALDIGGAMLDLTTRLQGADNPREQHVVIFTPFKPAVKYFVDHLNAAGLPAEGLMGGTNPDELKRIIENFRATRGRIVCTIDFAQAFSLTPAEECYFIGYDWDPNDNRQAEDRLVPQQGVNPITSNYYSFLDTVDDFVAERVNIKSDNLNVTLKSFGT